MEILFATSNKHKFDEAKLVFDKFNSTNSNEIALTHYPFEYRELRSDSFEEIAKDAVTAAYQKCKKPVFVEDSGLSINSLNGFPGTFSAWVQKKIGNEGIIRLMNKVDDRSAKFVSTVAYHNGNKISTFTAICEGTISNKLLGEKGFGYDPLFIPKGEQSTFGQSIELKNKLSHRYKVLLKFCEYLSH